MDSNQYYCGWLLQIFLSIHRRCSVRHCRLLLASVPVAAAFGGCRFSSNLLLLASACLHLFFLYGRDG